VYYAAETWIMKAAGIRKLLTFEIRSYRSILKYAGKTRLPIIMHQGQSAEEFHGREHYKAEEAIQLFGHMSYARQETDKNMVDGDRHRGRPPRKWVDYIVDWCGRPLPEVVRLTADREEWRRVVSGLNGSQGP